MSITDCFHQCFEPKSKKKKKKKDLQGKPLGAILIICSAFGYFESIRYINKTVKVIFVCQIMVCCLSTLTRVFLSF